jgi:hypothetical protein
MNKRILVLLVVLLFFARIVYGLCSCFWTVDNVQIYLIGLKYYTTGLWPYFGPDVIYTHAQIPGALQGLLVGLPLYVLHIPESPFFLLNALVFAAIGLFAWYIKKRIPLIPSWLVWIWLLTAPWLLVFSTVVVNPSYVMPFAILFFVCIFELLPLYSTFVINPFLAALCIGFCITSIMQIHMSWVLTVPYCCIAFYYQFRKNKLFALKLFPFFLCGLLLGALTLLPTIMAYGTHSSGRAEQNIVFAPSNTMYIVTVYARFLSFASFEIPYMLGGDTPSRMAIIKENIWMAPIAIILLLAGWAQVAYFSICFFLKSDLPEWKPLKIIVIVSILLVYVCFLFSIKGPSSHTFYIMFPLAMFYSFYCYERLLSDNALLWKKVFGIFLVLGVLFHIGLAKYYFPKVSLYTDRAKVERAILEKNYKILGNRRADDLGYGY